MERPGGWDAETVSDALDLLQDLVLWELVADRWKQVGRLLGRLDAALATGDADEARDVVAELELSGPVRALRIGSTETKGIPEPVLDRRNALVHSLTLTAELAGRAGEQRDAPRTRAGRGDQPDR